MKSALARAGAIGITALAAVAVVLAVRGSSTGPGRRSELRPVAAASTTCSTLELPTLGGLGGTVTAVSGNGLLVGIADGTDGQAHPVLWRAGKAQALEVGLQAATPTGVNRAGVVVGTGFDPRRELLVGWWWSSGRSHELAVRAGDVGQPSAIDDAGHVVGSLVADEEHADGPGADEDSRAAYWPSPTTLPRELPALPHDPSAEAFAIAPDGTVGGVSVGSGGSPVVWSPKGAVRRLGGSAGQRGEVAGFDGSSRPVGQVSVSGGTRAARWSTDGTTVSLGEAGAHSQALAGAGSIMVGTATGGDRTDGRAQAMIWDTGAARMLTPVRSAHFTGVQGTATAAAQNGARTLIGGYSANAVGLRRPTEWSCAS